MLNLSPQDMYMYIQNANDINKTDKQKPLLKNR